MLKGKGISNGIGIGRALILKKQNLEIEKSNIQNVEEELKKLHLALEAVIKETEETISVLEKESNKEQVEIMKAYLMILQDETLLEKAKIIIKEEKLNSVYATKKGLDEIISNFKNLDNDYLAGRSKDIEDIKLRIIRKLLNKQEEKVESLESETIIITEELTTSDISKIDLKNVTGIISEIGGTNSHVSIIARNKQKPMIIRVSNLVEKVKNGDIVIINGETGEIFINPSIEEMEKYKSKQSAEKKEKVKLEEYRNKQAQTKDGYKVEISCNIGNQRDLKDYHGFECVNFGGRYKFISKQKIHEAAEMLFSSTKMAVLSQAAMETLAIIAYKQPITRIEIEEIRGVNCDNMVRKLLARNLIKECGRTDGPGKPFLYEVTEEFMDAFKLESLKELPDLPMIEQNMDKELFGDEDMFSEA